MPSIFTLQGASVAQIPNGKSRGLSPEQFDPAQLAIGTRVEMEHTINPQIAQRIAMDHLVEDRDYYKKLRQVHLDGASTQRSWIAAAIIGGIGIVIGAVAYAHKRGGLFGSLAMSPEVIAKESKTPEEYARRVDAWNAAERDPVSQAKLVNAYMRTDPRGKTRMANKLRQLLREAEESRLESRERLWSKMSRGLRGMNGYRVAYLERGKRVVSDFNFPNADGAAAMVRRYKRRGFTTWVEDDQGNFVPVKGAMTKPRSL